MQKPVPKEEKLRRYKIWCECNGRTGQAASEAGITESTMRRSVREARKLLGEPEVPDGFKLTGKSTLYDAQTGEPKIEWVKTTEDRERQQAIFAEAIADMAKSLPRVTVKPPKPSTNDLMACYPIADHHHGMLAWEMETGADYDIEISQKLLTGAFDHLVDCAPSCNRAAVIFGGDFFHYDSTVPETPGNKNKLDADSRFQKMVGTGVALARYAIEKPAEKHAEVEAVILPGNHDPYSSVFLAACLANIYENNPRIKISTSPRLYQYLQFGKCLVGLHHGHKAKARQLPILMATDMPEAWGESIYRYWWTFHVHHDQAEKEHPGCKVESFRVLAAPDAFAAQEGYRAMQDMKAQRKVFLSA